MVSKTWAEVKTFDDLISSEERQFIRKLERERGARCPALAKEGEYFYYCKINLLKVEDKEPRPFHPIYNNHVGVTELELYCMACYEDCLFYKKRISKEKEIISQLSK